MAVSTKISDPINYSGQSCVHKVVVPLHSSERDGAQHLSSGNTDALGSTNRLRTAHSAACLPPHADPMMTYLPHVCPSPSGGALLLSGLGIMLVYCCTKPKRERFFCDFLLVQRRYDALLVSVWRQNWNRKKHADETGEGRVGCSSWGRQNVCINPNTLCVMLGFDPSLERVWPSKDTLANRTPTF